MDPVALVETAIGSVTPAADAEGIRISSTITSPLPMILGDRARMRQVLWNLLSNAVKFTSRGGRVEVVAEAHEASVFLRVVDNGVGIPADFLPHVFEGFRQADESMTRAHGGLGVGLALVKQLVELHGGTVAAESDGPGRGAAFTVRLPEARDA